METFAELRRVPGLVHALATRAGGVSTGPFCSLNLGYGVGDERQAVQANRARTASVLGFPGIIFPRQVHGRGIVYATGEGPCGDGDAIVVERPGVLAGVLGADCPGVLLVAPGAGVLALLHAGWRGVVTGLALAVVRRLADHHRCDPAQLLAAIGPGIGPARYEVGLEVAEQLAKAAVGVEGVIQPGRPGHAHADLVAALHGQLLAAGLQPAHVALHGSCTFTAAERFFSHRRDQGRTGRHALVAGWADR